MNWWALLGAVGYCFLGLLTLSIAVGIISNAVEKTREKGRYRAEIFLPPEMPNTGSGTLTVRLDSEAELLAFVKAQREQLGKELPR